MRTPKALHSNIDPGERDRQVERQTGERDRQVERQTGAEIDRCRDRQVCNCLSPPQVSSIESKLDSLLEVYRHALHRPRPSLLGEEPRPSLLGEEPRPSLLGEEPPYQTACSCCPQGGGPEGGEEEDGEGGFSTSSGSAPPSYPPSTASLSPSPFCSPDCPYPALHCCPPRPAPRPSPAPPLVVVVGPGEGEVPLRGRAGPRGEAAWSRPLSLEEGRALGAPGPAARPLSWAAGLGTGGRTGGPDGNRGTDGDSCHGDHDHRGQLLIGQPDPETEEPPFQSPPHTHI